MAEKGFASSVFASFLALIHPRSAHRRHAPEVRAAKGRSGRSTSRTRRSPAAWRGTPRSASGELNCSARTWEGVARRRLNRFTFFLVYFSVRRISLHFRLPFPRERKIHSQTFSFHRASFPATRRFALRIMLQEGHGLQRPREILDFIGHFIFNTDRRSEFCTDVAQKYSWLRSVGCPAFY